MDDLESRLIEALLQKLNENRTQVTTPAPHTDTDPNAPTFTLSQIGSFLFALVMISGSIVTAWIQVSSKIETQQVSFDLIISQVKKDIDIVKEDNAALSRKMEAQQLATQATIKESSTRVDELDSTVNQLYNRTSIISRRSK